MRPLIVGIRFQKIGKIYHFDASKCGDIQVGDHAVVDTSRGCQLGEIVQILEDPTQSKRGKWKAIQRKATPRDLVLRQIWQRKEVEAEINSREKCAELGLIGVKIAAAEFTFDGTRLTFLYSSEADAKVDVEELRKAMQRSYPRNRVELRQVGPRDVAKRLGGLGACGLDKRCCSMFITEFSPISIKMAKAQGISLSPSEITGMCGRLRCCMVYEYQLYVEARKTLPKRGKRVLTPLGEGKVIGLNLLKSTVRVELEKGVRQEFNHDEVQPWEELKALTEKAKEPCVNHAEGGCRPVTGRRKRKKRKRR